MTDEPVSNPVEPSYALTIDGNGITVNRDVPESIARAVIALVMGGTAPATAAVTLAGAALPSSAVPGGTVGAQSVREYLDETEANRNPDKIVAIAGYLKSQGQLSFSREDIKQQFPKAGESIPGNYPRDFSLTVSSGWIAEHGNTGTFYITAKGEKAIAGGFSDKIRRPNAKRKSRKAETADE